MSGKLKEVRTRIKSVMNTQQITKAMKMVSAAKFRKAQQSIVQLRPYADRLGEILTHLLSNLEKASTPYAERRKLNSALVVVITSNRGLCGAFNTNVIKAATTKIENDFAGVRKNKNLSILCIGKKANDFFKRHYGDCELIEDHVDVFSDITFENVSEVSTEVMQKFLDGSFDQVYVSYGRFKNAATQFPECERFLPVAGISSKMDSKKKKKRLRSDYIFEPDKEMLLRHLIPDILNTVFYRYVLDTHASEHGARMTAMDKATENAEEMLYDLRLKYNKARQETITKEISEIVGGAAALGG